MRGLRETSCLYRQEVASAFGKHIFSLHLFRPFPLLVGTGFFSFVEICICIREESADAI